MTRSQTKGRETDRRVRVKHLQLELRRIQHHGLGLGLQMVKWKPGGRTEVDGEVVGDLVLVYAKGRREAIDCLRHEVLHHEIVESQKPFLRLVNAILAGVNEEVRRRTERLADRLAEILEGEQ